MPKEEGKIVEKASFHVNDPQNVEQYDDPEKESLRKNNIEQIIGWIDKIKLPTKEMFKTEENIMKKVTKLLEGQEKQINNVNSLENSMNEFSEKEDKINDLQKEFQQEFTNKTYLQNTLNYDINLLMNVMKSDNKSHQIIINQLEELSQEIFKLGLTQEKIKNEVKEFVDKVSEELNQVKEIFENFKKVAEKDLIKQVINGTLDSLIKESLTKKDVILDEAMLTCYYKTEAKGKQ